MELKTKPISSIIVNLGLETNGPVHAFFTEACYRYMDKYVPKDIGNLREIVSLTTDTITYESNYAAYQYKGEREDGTHKVKKYTTPGTGPYWDKRMISAEKDDIVKEVQDYIGGKR